MMNFSIQTGSVPNFTASRLTGWFKVSFPQAFPNPPVVFAQTQTYTGPDTPGIRIKNVSASGFEVRMDELVAHGSSTTNLGNMGKFTSDGIHPNAETLGWVAIG